MPITRYICKGCPTDQIIEGQEVRFQLETDGSGLWEMTVSKMQGEPIWEGEFTASTTSTAMSAAWGVYSRTDGRFTQRYWGVDFNCPDTSSAASPSSLSSSSSSPSSASSSSSSSLSTLSSGSSLSSLSSPSSRSSPSSPSSRSSGSSPSSASTSSSSSRSTASSLSSFSSASTASSSSSSSGGCPSYDDMPATYTVSGTMRVTKDGVNHASDTFTATISKDAANRWWANLAVSTAPVGDPGYKITQVFVGDEGTPCEWAISMSNDQQLSTDVDYKIEQGGRPVGAYNNLQFADYSTGGHTYILYVEDIIVS